MRAGDEDDEEVVRADFARDACRKSDAEKRQVQLDFSILSFFYMCVFVERFFVCAFEASDSRRRKNPPTPTPACDLSFRRHEKQVPGV